MKERNGQNEPEREEDNQEIQWQLGIVNLWDLIPSITLQLYRVILH